MYMSCFLFSTADLMFIPVYKVATSVKKWLSILVNKANFVHNLFLSVDITNKMQPCNRIYYFNVCWRVNMFRAAHRSLSGALNCICSLWFTYTCGDRLMSSCQNRLDNSRSPHVYVNQRLQIQFRAPDDEGFAARNMLTLQ